LQTFAEIGKFAHCMIKLLIITWVRFIGTGWKWNIRSAHYWFYFRHNMSRLDEKLPFGLKLQDGVKIFKNNINY